MEGKAKRRKEGKKKKWKGRRDENGRQTGGKGGIKGGWRVD